MRRALVGLMDAPPATLASVMAIGSGAWLATALLGAGVQPRTAFTTSAAWHALAAFVGLLSLVDIALAWREHARRGIDAVTPLAVAALDGAALLAVHALARWSARCEQLQRLLGGASLLAMPALTCERLA